MTFRFVFDLAQMAAFFALTCYAAGMWILQGFDALWFAATLVFAESTMTAAQSAFGE